MAGRVASAGADLLNWSCTGHYLHETLGFTALTSKGLGALVPHQLGIRVDRSISIYRPIEEVYRFFRDFKNLGRVLTHVNGVRAENVPVSQPRNQRDSSLRGRAARKAGPKEKRVRFTQNDNLLTVVPDKVGFYLGIIRFMGPAV